MKKFIILNGSVWLSIIAVIISFTSIVICIISPREDSFITLDSFVGVCVALLAILVTIILGWQIYNAVEIKEKIRKLDALHLSQQQYNHRLDQMYFNTCHHQSSTLAYICAHEGDYVNAYRLYLNSLCNSLLLDEPINTEMILREMVKCVEKIPSNKKLDKDLWEEIEEDHKSIINSPIFDCIKSQYMATYDIFISKVSKI